LTKGEIDMSERNKEIIAKVNAAFAEGSTEGFLAFCAEGVEWTIVGDKPVRGKDAIRKRMGSMDLSEPPKFTIDNVIAERDFVVAHGEMSMKEQGGKAVPYSYCDIYRFRDDKIVELRSFVIKTEATHQTNIGRK
jgi:ketosteroid isomerase-like protein